MVRTQVYLPESQKRRLKRRAIQKGVTFSETVRELIDKSFELEKEKEKEKATEGSKSKNGAELLLEIARDAEKYGFSGPTDGSVNHDKYIYGAPGR
jgi:ribosomal protein S16